MGEDGGEDHCGHSSDKDAKPPDSLRHVLQRYSPIENSDDILKDLENVLPLEQMQVEGWSDMSLSQKIHFIIYHAVAREGINIIETETSLLPWYQPVQEAMTIGLPVGCTIINDLAEAYLDASFDQMAFKTSSSGMENVPVCKDLVPYLAFADLGWEQRFDPVDPLGKTIFCSFATSIRGELATENDRAWIIMAAAKAIRERTSKETCSSLTFREQRQQSTDWLLHLLGEMHSKEMVCNIANQLEIPVSVLSVDNNGSGHCERICPPSLQGVPHQKRVYHYFIMAPNVISGRQSSTRGLFPLRRKGPTTPRKELPLSTALMSNINQDKEPDLGSSLHCADTYGNKITKTPPDKAFGLPPLDADVKLDHPYGAQSVTLPWSVKGKNIEPSEQEQSYQSSSPEHDNNLGAHDPSVPFQLRECGGSILLPPKTFIATNEDIASLLYLANGQLNILSAKIPYESKLKEKLRQFTTPSKLLGENTTRFIALQRSGCWAQDYCQHTMSLMQPIREHLLSKMELTRLPGTLKQPSIFSNIPTDEAALMYALRHSPLTALYYRPVTVVGDGNCLLRAVAMGAFGSSSGMQARQLRYACAQFVADNLDNFALAKPSDLGPTIDSFASPLDELFALSFPSNYLSDVTWFASASVTQVELHIHFLNKWIQDGGHSIFASVLPKDDGSIKQQVLPQVHIAYCSASITEDQPNHYVYLEPRDPKASLVESVYALEYLRKTSPAKVSKWLEEAANSVKEQLGTKSYDDVFEEYISKAIEPINEEEEAVQKVIMTDVRVESYRLLFGDSCHSVHIQKAATSIASSFHKDPNITMSAALNKLEPKLKETLDKLVCGYIPCNQVMICNNCLEEDKNSQTVNQLDHQALVNKCRTDFVDFQNSGNDVQELREDVRVMKFDTRRGIWVQSEQTLSDLKEDMAVMPRHHGWKPLSNPLHHTPNEEAINRLILTAEEDLAPFPSLMKQNCFAVVRDDHNPALRAAARNIKGAPKHKHKVKQEFPGMKTGNCQYFIAEVTENEEQRDVRVFPASDTGMCYTSMSRKVPCEKQPNQDNTVLIKTQSKHLKKDEITNMYCAHEVKLLTTHYSEHFLYIENTSEKFQFLNGRQYVEYRGMAPTNGRPHKNAKLAKRTAGIFEPSDPKSLLMAKEMLSHGHTYLQVDLALRNKGFPIRSRRTLYNIKKRDLLAEPGEMLLGPRSSYADQLEEFFRMIEMSQDEFLLKSCRKQGREPLFICAKPYMFQNIARLCNRQGSVILGIDRTFNVSPFFLTVTCYRQPHLVWREKEGQNPYMIGPVMLHKEADAEAYKEFFITIREELRKADASATFNHFIVSDEVQESLDRQPDVTMAFCTDGERAMISALNDVFEHSSVIQCRQHLERATKRYLMKEKKAFVRPYDELLSDLFYSNTALKKQISQEEFTRKYAVIRLKLQERAPSFLPYFETLAKILSEHVGTQLAHMASNYTNNAIEGMNYSIRHQMRHMSTTLLKLFRHVKNISTYQLNNIEKALYDSGDYALHARSVKPMTPQQWKMLTEIEQRNRIKKFILLPGVTTGQRVSKEGLVIAKDMAVSRKPGQQGTSQTSSGTRSFKAKCNPRRQPEFPAKLQISPKLRKRKKSISLKENQEDVSITDGPTPSKVCKVVSPARNKTIFGRSNHFVNGGTVSRKGILEYMRDIQNEQQLRKRACRAVIEDLEEDEEFSSTASEVGDADSKTPTP